MIPSILAEELISALEDYLRIGFRPSNDALHYLIDEFLESRGSLAKGPFIEVDLPFSESTTCSNLLDSFSIDQTPYRHQQKAFERLQTEVGKSTLITTGTGSGKTECFMYPILDYCLRFADQRGIKAIVIYPMNALADDQAKRFAAAISSTPQLASKISVGLYTGNSRDDRDFMSEDHVIESKHALRKNPPCILLTNYKMLDLLLIRSEDHPLWSDNTPTSLRYLVVDELHTYDGAQGTDLACLIRRVKEALEIPKSHLVCVGTSATIGTAHHDWGLESKEELIEFARKIYAESFDDESIITEHRQSLHEFIDGANIEYTLGGGQNQMTVIDHREFDDFDAYIDHLHETFFEVRLDRSKENWEISLGERLRQHSAFRVFLDRVINNSRGLCSLGEIGDAFEQMLPANLKKNGKEIATALCALISVARVYADENDFRTAPFLRLRFHVWIRELRRMVASISEPLLYENGSDESSPRYDQWNRHKSRIRFSDDLRVDEPSVHFPLIQCRECRVTGWAALLAPASRQFSTNLTEFYDVFFGNDTTNRIRLLFKDVSTDWINKGSFVSVCSACGHRIPKLDNSCDSATCVQCGESRVTSLFELSLEREHTDLAAYDCTFCRAKGGMILFGAQISTQMSVILSQLYGSNYNSDRKTILFSDNVQDSAHRASFIGARTWRDVVTSSIFNHIPDTGSISLAELAENVSAPVNDELQGLEIEHICRYIPPDLLYLQDYQYLLNEHRLPDVSKNISLTELLVRRLKWEVYAQFSFETQNRRSLETQLAVAVGLDVSLIEIAAGEIEVALEEQLNLRQIPARRVKHVLLYLLRLMRLSGAVNIDLESLRLALKKRKVGFVLNLDRALRNTGPSTQVPQYPALQEGLDRQFYDYVLRGSSRYMDWIRSSIFDRHALSHGIDKDAIRLIFDKLLKVGLICRFPDSEGPGFALDSDKLTIKRGRPALLVPKCDGPRIVVPLDEVQHWIGMPVFGHNVGEYVQSLTEDVTSSSLMAQNFQRINHTRIRAVEHTALVSSETRSKIQDQFSDTEPQPWYPNLVSATPTLELGVDIGDLSTVMLCQMPPSPNNYVQRVGRAGRRNGNALALTMASARSHDLYFYEDPSQMLSARLKPPNLYMNASAVLRRQLNAFCMNKWVASNPKNAFIPHRLGSLVSPKYDRQDESKFPGSFLKYVANHAIELTRTFLAMIDSRDISNRTKNELNAYVIVPTYESEQEENLHTYLQEIFHSVKRDLDSQENDIRRRQREVSQLSKLPQDETSSDEIKRLKREIAALRSLQIEIRGKGTLEFLTDEGFLPNYAFPESGIKLRSVIFRSTHDEDYHVDTYEYIRPASSALTEFAPEIWFYAESRRVQIDRVDFNSSEDVQDWRMCPNCKYLERIDIDDKYDECPRCGTHTYAEIGSKVSMLLLKRVEATTSDSVSQIMDDREYREPTYFIRNLLTQFEEEPTYSWATTGHAFSFEYFHKAIFRDINFGENDDSYGAGFGRVAHAGQVIAKGFNICKKCGAVEEKNGQVTHRRQCANRSLNTNTMSCLYLYREFVSEAIRIVLPFDPLTVTENHAQSLIAALELGLQELYQGRVAHLRFTFGRFPVNNRQTQVCVVLYDSVPGGTGYIKNIVDSKDQIIGLFHKSLHALQHCECVEDPTQDGCYRCVYQFRRRADIKGISRRNAVRAMQELLVYLSEIQPVKGPVPYQSKRIAISGSQIETLFLEALRTLVVDGNATIVRTSVHRGTQSWNVKSSSSENSIIYSVRSEVRLDHTDGVMIPCKPDFLFTPHPDELNGREIAVFLDGFSHHRNTTARDSLVRTSLIRAGYVVWSFSYQDLAWVNQFPLQERPESLIDILMDYGPAEHSTKHVQLQLDQRWGIDDVRSSIHSHPLELFVRYMRNPDQLSWERAIFTELLSLINTAQGSVPVESDPVNSFLDLLSTAEQEAFKFDVGDTVLTGSHQYPNTQYAAAHLILRVVLEPDALGSEPNPEKLRVAMYLNDEYQDDEGWRVSWNSALWLWNRLQFLKFTSWTTSSGLNENLYESLGPPLTSTDTVDCDWAELSEYCVVSHSDLRALKLAGLPLPTPGFELKDEHLTVVAEAELAWEERKLAVLTSKQVEIGCNLHFLERKWSVVQINDEAWVKKLIEMFQSQERG